MVPRIALLLAVCLLLELAAAATPGRPLPELGEVIWLRAPPERTSARVVVCWASWSAPCLQAVPRLNRLQQEFGGRLTVVALSNEQPARLRDFLAQGGRILGFALGAIDERRFSGLLADGDSIPVAHLVAASGRVVWSGHPLLVCDAARGLLERGLDEQTVMRIHQLEREVFEQLRQRAWDRAMATAGSILRLDPEHAFMRELLQRMRAARSKQPDLYP